MVWHPQGSSGPKNGTGGSRKIDLPWHVAQWASKHPQQNLCAQESVTGFSSTAKQIGHSQSSNALVASSTEFRPCKFTKPSWEGKNMAEGIDYQDSRLQALQVVTDSKVSEKPYATLSCIGPMLMSLRNGYLERGDTWERISACVSKFAGWLEVKKCWWLRTCVAQTFCKAVPTTFPRCLFLFFTALITAVAFRMENFLRVKTSVLTAVSMPACRSMFLITAWRKQSSIGSNQGLLHDTRMKLAWNLHEIHFSAHHMCNIGKFQFGNGRGHYKDHTVLQMQGSPPLTPLPSQWKRH